MKSESRMTIECNNWRIQSYEYGYQLQRRINPTRWRVDGYYPSLAMAVESLFNQRIQAETSNFTIRPLDQAVARASTVKLVKKIELIAEQIQKAVRDAN